MTSGWKAPEILYMKEVSLSEWTLNGVEPLDEQALKTGVSMALIGTDEAPPHLLLIVGERFYSLDIKGITLGSDTTGLLKFLRRTKKKAAFVQLIFEVSPEAARKRIENILRQHTCVSEEVTCLAPICFFCNQLSKADLGPVRFVFDLVQILSEHRETGAVFVLNQEEKVLTDKRLHLPLYNMEKVRKNIRGKQREAR